MIARVEHDLRWSPALALLVRAFVRSGCAISLIPITTIRCGDITRCLDAEAFARSGIRELEDFLQHRS